MSRACGEIFSARDTRYTTVAFVVAADIWDDIARLRSNNMRYLLCFIVAAKPVDFLDGTCV